MMKNSGKNDISEYLINEIRMKQRNQTFGQFILLSFKVFINTNFKVM